MRKLFITTVSSLILVSCATDDIAKIVETSPVAAPQSAVVEFMYCNFGSEMSAESWSDLKAAWLDINGGDDSPINAAFTLVPVIETDLYDGVWANVFADEASRKAGWASWNESYAEAFQAKFGDVLTCHADKTFAFTSSWSVRPAKQWDMGETHQAAYSFCSVNEGKTMADSDKAADGFVAAMDAGRAQNGPDGYSSARMMPMFDPATAGGTVASFDYVQSHYWDTSEEKAQGMKSWMMAGNPLRAAFEEAATCDNIDFELNMLKM